MLLEEDEVGAAAVGMVKVALAKKAALLDPWPPPSSPYDKERTKLADVLNGAMDCSNVAANALPGDKCNPLL